LSLGTCCAHLGSTVTRALIGIASRERLAETVAETARKWARREKITER
jgi:hypothetical protein